MSFDHHTLSAVIARHGPVARVVVAGVGGSTPREVGAAMLVWADGQEGTIGGGTLEFEAAARAREALVQARDRLDRMPLGPTLGQCCGGTVTLLTEIWDRSRLATADGEVVARPLPGGPEEPPLAVSRRLTAARGARSAVVPELIAGWMIEPISRPSRAIWIYGAGHVGRAIVSVLAPLPDLAITWVDTGPGRFPDAVPPGVTPLIAANPADCVRHAPQTAEHLILTYSHALDLELCHRLLAHGFASVGLIGSRTKWARFRNRLKGLGHTPAQIDRIACPIGDPALGKHPQAIAVGVATGLLRTRRMERAEKDATG